MSSLSFANWLPKMADSSRAASSKTELSPAEAEATHRRRMAQILRYIASMHHSLQSDGVGPSFVQEIAVSGGREQRRPPADFFQTEEDQSEWILFTTTDFRRLLNVEQNSPSGPLFATPPFSFYAAVTDSAAQQRKRTFAGAFSRTDSSTASEDGAKKCWLRITRLSNAQLAAGSGAGSGSHSSATTGTTASPEVMLRRPAVREYMDGWLAQTPGARTHQDLLTLDRLQKAPKVPPTAPRPQEVHAFLRNTRKYLRRQTYQNILEPMYNHLFEWSQQANDEELVFGLGHARCFLPSADDSGTGIGGGSGTWITSPVLEVLMEVEVSRRDGSLLLRPREHTGVTLHRPFLAAVSAEKDLNPTTVAQLHQRVAEVEATQLCPGQPETYVPLLREIAMQVAADGTFQSSSKKLSPQNSDPSKLVVTEAWCLFRRPKPSSVWARDATKFADKIMMNAASAADSSSVAAPCDAGSTGSLDNLPLATWALTFGPQVVEEKRQQLIAKQKTPQRNLWDRFFGVSPESSPVMSSPLSKPLFPLPTSGPQSRIAELLFSGYPAVVCSGPPGSGKSHTICNIVSAYLCQGKRVLVTSKNAHALAVLKERLPGTVRELCVDVSMSELSGMRQLQQTVERLANRVSMVSGDLESQKCNFLREKIHDAEMQIETIDSKLAELSKPVRELLMKPEGQEFSKLSLELIESVPWLMRTVCQWTLPEIVQLRDAVREIVLDTGDPIHNVTGFQHPPSSTLLNKAQAKAGRSLQRLTDTAMTTTASLPLIGNLSGLKEKDERATAELQDLKFRGSTPITPADWSVVANALRHSQTFFIFETTIWKVHEYKNAWPEFSTIKSNESLRDLLGKIDRVVQVKNMSIELGVEDEMESAANCRSLDLQRSILVTHTQKMAVDLVDATVLVELSRSFSPQAQSALIRFAQIAGRARFSRSSQSAKMTQRQRRRRQEYLAAFDQCCRFIPCWILTSSQISDYLPAEGLFDLVVVDEASQSDVTVMPGMLRGKQWLIVGDSKQVSPTESFISEDQISGLQAALPPSPIRDSLLPGQSFFDLCSQAFPGGRVVLHEHFRCAEEIISFSNDHFYDGQLVPLRLPTKSERLTPSLVDVKVNGTKQGKVNLAEVEKIVKIIQEIVESGKESENPRSIGVISLIGDEQSRMVRGRLLDSIGPHAMSRHDILIGDPPSFQGAERDIVFLSVVASPGSVPTQNQLMHFQRLNVAMSRARDRCYLVRSIEPHHIPNAEDCKLMLLTFFTADEPDEDESDSEAGLVKRNSYNMLLTGLLKQRGFRVRPMGRVWHNGLCVENDKSDARVAILVDCIGEPVHEWTASYSQQRAIERVGWKCLRVDAVSLVADFHGTLQAVVSFLGKCGIEETKEIYVDLDESENDEVDDEMMEQEEQPIDANVEEPLPNAPLQDDDVCVISSDDEGDTRSNDLDEQPQVAMPDPIRSTVPDQESDRPDQFGQIVDLGFLRDSQEDLESYDVAMAEANQLTKKRTPREGEYEADASDMGESLLSSSQKRRKYQRLTKYARDPRWHPRQERKTGEDEEEAHWYDTDSDLMEGDKEEEDRDPSFLGYESE